MKTLKNRAVFIVPYYGKLPAYYENWKYTALLNTDFDFLLISDIPEIKEEKNIHVINMTFDSLRELIQNQFDFTIRLDTPYKLCDYKPAYGYIFSDFIKDYEFWGHCDMDILMGDLSRFITKDILDHYDKIFEHGHMTLYRNTEQNNAVFMSQGPYPEISFKEVFESPESYWFDEFFGMMLKSRRVQCNTYLNPEILIDLNPAIFHFESVLTDHGELIVEWKNGKIYVYSLRDHARWEVAYVHFQKRKLEYLKGLFNNPAQRIFIYPDHFTLNNKIEHISRKKTIAYSFKYKIGHIKDFLHRYTVVKKHYKLILFYYVSRQRLKQRKKLADTVIWEFRNNGKRKQDY